MEECGEWTRDAIVMDLALAAFHEAYSLRLSLELLSSPANFGYSGVYAWLSVGCHTFYSRLLPTELVFVNQRRSCRIDGSVTQKGAFANRSRRKIERSTTRAVECDTQAWHTTTRNCDLKCYRNNINPLSKNDLETFLPQLVPAHEWRFRQFQSILVEAKLLNLIKK